MFLTFLVLVLWLIATNDAKGRSDTIILLAWKDVISQLSCIVPNVLETLH